MRWKWSERLAGGRSQSLGRQLRRIDPEVRPHFDRIFLGYSENEVAEALGHRVESLLHPPLLVPFGMPFLKIVRYGLLFTTRGCSFGCTFCQTPAFAPKPSTIPLESIERVLQCYADHGVVDLIIPDENFGVIPHHADEVTALLAKHRMLWTAMTRADFLVRHFDQWQSRGLAGVMIGVESLDQQGLERASEEKHDGEAPRGRRAVPKTRHRHGRLLHDRLGVRHGGVDSGQRRRAADDGFRPRANVRAHAASANAPLVEQSRSATASTPKTTASSTASTWCGTIHV